MNRADVGVIERGRGLSFAQKARRVLAVFREFGGQNLQRDAAMKLCIFGQIHLAHSAHANLRADFVAAEFCAYTQSHRRSVTT